MPDDSKCGAAECAALHSLTAKQREVLDLLVKHMTSKEIARSLGISPHTVDQRVQFAKDKLGASSRGELAQEYLRLVSICEPVTYEDSRIVTSITSDDDLTGNAALSVELLEDRDRMQSDPLDRAGRDYRVLPEMFEGRYGTLARLTVIAVLALLLVFLALGGLALFNAASQLWMG
ncbi:MAG: helix-turn-helix transcriptional regulator [Sphingomonadales bacterium]|nr:helix-turn-helix transcriptional regulator [Sphingomonadales bacterium]MBD3774985.1 helix-turn-helix transcriptional regulator [Paracoccaceae bacterium]